MKTTVKGSEQHRMIVVPYRPYMRAFIITVLLLSTIAAVGGSFYLGNYLGTNEQRDAIAERDQLRVAVSEKTAILEKLDQQVANLKLGAEVDRKAGEEVRAELTSLKRQVAELEQDITFYRSLMHPTADSKGLTIGSLNILSASAPRHYEYKLVVQQLVTEHRVLRGHVEFTIVGREGDSVRRLSLKDISNKVSTKRIPLRFKYFQRIEGELVLPTGFEPERIELKAMSTGRNGATVEKKFGWLVQET